MDFVGLLGSGIAMYFYVITKNWIFNNIIATMVSISGIQLMFLGNFKNGFLMLSGLFFYDIFFVFKTDVMLTVAKSIDAPIKLLFPNDWSADPPKFSLLGLGDIVIPGIFMAMCLRWDVIRALKASAVNDLADQGDLDEVPKKLYRSYMMSPKSYYLGTVIGYLLAIITTVVIMILFDHGQPALLYLVPACLGSTTLIALCNGEWKKLWEYSEEILVDDPEEEEAEDDKKTK
jgi:minor histocompatibility antigen H13